MNDMNVEHIQFWDAYLESVGLDGDDLYVEASIAGDYAIADDLLELYLLGKKTAGSGLVQDFKLAGDELPVVGNYWIVLDTNDNPSCILKTVRVEINKFKNITLEIAQAEGEGEQTVEYWHRVHREFFTPFLADLKITNLDEEDVVTEFYELVYRGSVN